MKFLRNPSTREIFSFPADGSEDAFIPGGLEVMTPEDISVHCNPVYQPTRVEVDAERDKRIDGGSASMVRTSNPGQSTANASSKLLNWL
ncbi:hypothetical protein PSm6_03340 [Pseudomonas solani]|uniref:Uncharacterized protein n=1 Tax=Pseudomonas solani TaxID=2731552 RepID=A0ABN6BLD9_9PSED|nr:hypothetical protein [Pseudomonas solani]BCD83927.1 hypothetical protein PSm6_03340 [Pseudomonas solani]